MGPIAPLPAPNYARKSGMCGGWPMDRKTGWGLYAARVRREHGCSHCHKPRAQSQWQRTLRFRATESKRRKSGAACRCQRENCGTELLGDMVRTLQGIGAAVRESCGALSVAARCCILCSELRRRRIAGRAILAEEKPKTPALFADGLDRLLRVDSFPTTVILDRSGKIAFRSDGFDPDDFEKSLGNAIDRVAAPAGASAAAAVRP